MKRRLSAIALALPLFFSPLCLAQTIEELEEVSVTANRVPVLIGRSARIITLLDSISIRNTPAESINSLFSRAVGVDVRQRGGLGAQADISIRGGNFDQIAFLINGINICDPNTGHNSADFPMELADIERIEIIEGPAARLYGTSAMLGAVNIVTRPDTGNHLSVRAEGGSHAFASAAARFNLSKGGLGGRLSASHTRSDGHSRNAAGGLNADFSSTKLFCHGTHSSPLADISLYAGLSVKDFGANTFYSPKYDDQFEHTAKIYTALQVEGKGRLRLKGDIYWNSSRDRFELFRGKPEIYPFNYHLTSVAGLNVGGWFESVMGKTAFGSEIRNEDILSTNLGERLDAPVSQRYTNGLNRTHITLYFDHTLLLRRFSFSAGVSAVRNTALAGKMFGYYPGADVSLRLGSFWKLYASVNTSLRMPTFTELYYSVGGHAADRNLLPEKMAAYETGVKYLRSGLNLTLSLYHNRGRDLIDWIRDVSAGDDSPWRSVNHARVNTTGEEINLRLELDRLFGFGCWKSLSAGYAHIGQDKVAEEGTESLYTLEYLRHKVAAQADFSLADNLDFALSYRYCDRFGTYAGYEGGVPDGKIHEYEPYHIVDARLSWQLPRFRIYAEGYNLLDTTYYDYGNVPQMGISAKIGIIFAVSGL